MADSDDVLFVEELNPTSSNAVKIAPREDHPFARAKTSMKMASSQSQNLSSVLMSNWVASARRDQANTKRLDARRKAAGVMRSPAKRAKIEKINGRTDIDTITLDDQEEVEIEENDESNLENKKKCTKVTGSVVTAVAASILSPRRPLSPIKVSPANSQTSQNSKVGSTSSICDEETQENDNDSQGEIRKTPSQELRTTALRDCLRVDDGNGSLRDGDVVRKRADRAAMHGQDCPCCSEYYDILGMDEEERKRRIDQVSRHRYVARPMPKTPPHYWDMDFPTEEEQMARGMLTRRVEEKVDHSEGEEEIKDHREEKEEIKDQ